MPRLSKLFILKVNVSGFMISYSGRDIGIIFSLKFKIIHLYICFKHPTQAAFLTEELCLVACARQIHLMKKTCTPTTGLKFKPLKIQIILGAFLFTVNELADIQYNSISAYNLFFSHLEKSMALSRRWCYHMNQ